MNRTKIQSWAAESNGLFPLKSRNPLDSTLDYVSWNEASADPQMRGRVKWVPVKTAQRSILKILHCYGFQVSRLVDIARQRIIFDSIPDLMYCLTVINMDNDCEVCRVKNFMYEGHVSSNSAGN